MKTYSLHDWTHPAVDSDLLRSVRVRLLDPYTVVSTEVTLNRKTGKTHLPALGGRSDIGMTECGKNTRLRPMSEKHLEAISGPTLVTCQRCTLQALQLLARRGLLKWSKCSKGNR